MSIHVTSNICSRELIYQTVGCNPLDCVRLSLAAEPNRMQSDGFSLVWFDLFD